MSKRQSGKATPNAANENVIAAPTNASDAVVVVEIAAVESIDVVVGPTDEATEEATPETVELVLPQDFRLEGVLYIKGRRTVPYSVADTHGLLKFKRA